jgi:hypothetical protein
VEYNCTLIKIDWLAACIELKVVGAMLVVFLWRWSKIFTILQQKKQGLIPEEMSLTLLTNKKQRNVN